VKAITQTFLRGASDVMMSTACGSCGDGCKDDYLHYGKNSAMPIRGGLKSIWRGFPQAVPEF